MKLLAIGCVFVVLLALDSRCKVDADASANAALKSLYNLVFGGKKYATCSINTASDSTHGHIRFISKAGGKLTGTSLIHDHKGQPFLVVHLHNTEEGACARETHNHDKSDTKSIEGIIGTLFPHDAVYTAGKLAIEHLTFDDIIGKTLVVISGKEHHCCVIKKATKSKYEALSAEH